MNKQQPIYHLNLSDYHDTNENKRERDKKCQMLTFCGKTENEQKHTTQRHREFISKIFIKISFIFLWWRMILKKMKSSAYLIRANGTHNYNSKGKTAYHTTVPLPLLSSPAPAPPPSPSLSALCHTLCVSVWMWMWMWMPMLNRNHVHLCKENLSFDRIHTWDAFKCIINRLCELDGWMVHRMLSMIQRLAKVCSAMHSFNQPTKSAAQCSV